jgi:ketosteroid isomerase-like protein
MAKKKTTTPGASVPSTDVLRGIYDAFNRRELEAVLAMMQPDVKWANGMEGGFVHGRDAVREYWRRQFEATSSRLEPLTFDVGEDGRSVVTVHLIVTDLKGSVLADRTVRHIFAFEDGLISLFEIGDSEPLRLMDR